MQGKTGYTDKMQSRLDMQINDAGKIGNKGQLKKYRFDIQGSHLLLFTLLVMLGSYEPPCIVTMINDVT